MLQRRGADILAFDTASFDGAFNDRAKTGGGNLLVSTSCQGGPEGRPPGGCGALCGPGPCLDVVRLHGLQDVRLECLKGYKDAVLILLGEWHEAGTFGSFAPGMSPNGQSFSLEFQQAVEEDLELLKTLRLPNWTMSLDSVRLFRRKDK